MTTNGAMMHTPSKIPTWPFYEQDEQEAVQQVLASGRGNYWSGNEGIQFESEFADWCGTNHGLSVFNGTVALELALRAVGVVAGDEVIVTPRTFLASAAAIAAVGAIPIFADIELSSGNMTVDTIDRVKTSKTRAIVAVHLAGWPVNMPAVMEFAHANGIRVVEDCAQSHGAEIENTKVGSFGDANAFSFCQDKIMSTGGEGGMVTTNSDEIRDTVWSLRDHGRNRSKTLSADHPFGFRWTQDRIGTNARMTEMQSAIGRRQLLKVDSWVATRIKNANAILDGLRDCKEITLPTPQCSMKHAFYRLGALTSPAIRDPLIQHLASVGIPVSVGACPEVYREQAFVNLACGKQVDCPKAKELGAKSIAFPVHPGVEKHVDFIIEQTKVFFA